MLSRRRDILYPVNTEITNFDLGTDVEEYDYDGKLVFRGNLDPDYSDSEFQVYWLYDENQRVGLAEHHGDTQTAYWFRETVFSTLLQEDWESRDRTVWSMMSEPAYEDCMRYGWTTVESLQSRTSMSIIRPCDLVNYVVPMTTCLTCNTNDKLPGCLHEKRTPRFDIFFTLFVDDDGVLYAPPGDTQAFATLRRRAGAGAADTGAGAGAGAAALAVGVGASSVSSASASSSSSSSNAALAPPTTGAGTSSESSTSSLNISRAV